MSTTSPASLPGLLRRLFLGGLASLCVLSARAQGEPIVFKTADTVAYSLSATVSPYAAKVFVTGQPSPDGATALAGLESNLALLGLDRKTIAYVRASMTPRADGTLDMDSWNTA
ncbi:MAG: hypothetical protein RL376_887, partial [Verrucomicrobiota bacterium]